MLPIFPSCTTWIQAQFKAAIPKADINSGEALLAAAIQAFESMFHRLFDMLVVLLAFLLNFLDLLFSAVYWLRSKCVTRSRKSKKRVVIIGGSFSGLWAQRNLQHDFDVTVIDFKDYFEYTPGILRAFCDPAHLKAITCPLPTRHSRLLLAQVLSISDKSVKVRDVRTKEVSDVQFDYLLAGCGSLYQRPIKPSPDEPHVHDRIKAFENEHARLVAASSVLIIGGGPVGVELAGEILSSFPQKQVTIVDMAPVVCAPFPAATQRYIQQWLSSRGVELVLGATIAGQFPNLEISESGCNLTDGRQIQADIVYRCTGFKPNSDIFKEHFSDHIDRRGSVVVDDQLRLVGHPQIYVMGDVMIHSKSGEAKLGHTAEINAHLVVSNLLNLAMREDKRSGEGEQLLGPQLSYPSGVSRAPTSPKIYAISLGKYHCSLGFNWLVINGRLPALVKWALEWTKTAACGDRHIGTAFWKFGDGVSFLLHRTLLQPTDSSAKKK